MKKSVHTRKTKGDRVFYSICYLILTALMLLVLYPLVYIVSASFSSARAVQSGKVLLLPVEIGFDSYRGLLQYSSVWIGYRNTIFYTVVGTLINVTLTMMCAYPLARKHFTLKRIYTLLFMFTMIFNGGMIPNYINMKNLHLLNCVWALLLPGAINIYNLIVARTFIQNTIPDELLEAAKIDGCSDAGFFFYMILPLSKTIIAVLTMYYAVGHWNSYFNAFMYISEKNLYPLQIFLRQILIQNTLGNDPNVDEEIARQMQNMKELLKYAVIVVSSAPLMLVYPFAQRYFVKGVMIGSVKG